VDEGERAATCLTLSTPLRVERYSMPWRRWEITEPHSSSLGPRRSTFMPARGTSPSRRTRPTRTFLEALDESDDRALDVRVAGPSALVVAKLHKLSDRAHEPGSKRLKDKDALDVLRLLRASSSVALLVRGVRSVATPIAHG
jgi:hypothetical protein